MTATSVHRRRGTALVTVLVTAALLLILLTATPALADPQLASAGPAPDEQSHYAGAITLIALVAVVVFGARRIMRARRRQA